MVSIKSFSHGHLNDTFLNEDSVVYHFTCPDRLDSIKMNGLRPKSAPVLNRGSASESESLSFVSFDISSVKMWLKVLCHVWYECRTKPILLRINNTSGQYSIRRVVRDNRITDEFYTHDSIDPRDIEANVPWPRQLAKIDQINHPYCEYICNIWKDQYTREEWGKRQEKRKEWEQTYPATLEERGGKVSNIISQLPEI